MTTLSTYNQVGQLISNQLLGVSASTADSANALHTITDPQNKAGGIPIALNATVASSDVLGTAASNIQMLQQFTANSSEVGTLAGSVASKASIAGLLANIGLIANTALTEGPLQVSNSAIVSTVGAVASTGATFAGAIEGTITVAGVALAAPEIVIGLGILAAALTITALVTKGTLGGDLSDVENTLSKLQSAIQPYYNQLSSTDKATFNASLSNTIQCIYDGGMAIPQVDNSGQITGYSVAVPSSTTTQSDGSTVYSFSGGITYNQAPTGSSGLLLESTGNAVQGIWTIPEASTGNQATLCTYQDGSYSYNSKDAAGNNVALVDVNSTSGSDVVSAINGTELVSDTGSNNLVTASNGGLIDLAGNNTGANIDSSGGLLTEQLKNTITTNTAGAAVDDLLCTNPNNVTLWEQVTTTPTGGQVTQTVSGQGDKDNASNAAITLAAGAQATFGGTNNDVECAAPATVNLGKTSLSDLVNDIGGTISSSGTNNILNAGTNGTINDNGNGDHDTAGVNSNVVLGGYLGSGQTGGTNVVLNVGAGSYVYDNAVGANITAGTGSEVDVSANGAIVTGQGTGLTSNTEVLVQLSSGLTMTDKGTNNDVECAAPATVILGKTSVSDVVNDFGGTINSLGANNILNAGTNGTINDNGNGDHDTAGANSYVVLGASYGVSLTSTNAVLSVGAGSYVIDGATGSNITAGADSEVEVNANGAIVTGQGTGQTLSTEVSVILGAGLTLSDRGTDTDVECDGPATVNLGKNALSDIVNDIGGTINSAGTNGILNAGTNGTINDNGSGDHDTAGANSYVVLGALPGGSQTGGTNAVLSVGVGSYVIDGATGANISAGAGSEVDVNANGAIVNGQGTGLTANTEVNVYLGAGLTLSDRGTDTDVECDGPATVNLGKNALSDIVNDIGGTISSSGTNNILNAGANGTINDNGSGDHDTAGANSYVVLGALPGGSQTGGTNAVLSVGVGSYVIDGATGANISAGAGSEVDVNANGAIVSGQGTTNDAVSVYLGTGLTATDTGTNNDISGLSVNLDITGTGNSIHLTGGLNTITDNSAFVSSNLVNTITTDANTTLSLYGDDDTINFGAYNRITLDSPTYSGSKLVTDGANSNDWSLERFTGANATGTPLSIANTTLNADNSTTTVEVQDFVANDAINTQTQYYAANGVLDKLDSVFNNSGTEQVQLIANGQLNETDTTYGQDHAYEVDKFGTSGAQNITITDNGNQYLWSSITEKLNSSDQLTYSNVAFDNGASRTENYSNYGTDYQTNPQDYLGIQNDYQNGQLTDSVDHWFGASTIVTHYSANNADNYSSYVQTYNAQNVETAETDHWKTRGYDSINFDAANNQLWSTVDTQYNASNQEVGVYTQLDSGQLNMNLFNPSASAPTDWTTANVTINAAGTTAQTSENEVSGDIASLNFSIDGGAVTPLNQTIFHTDGISTEDDFTKAAQGITDEVTNIDWSAHLPWTTNTIDNYANGTIATTELFDPGQALKEIYTSVSATSQVTTTYYSDTTTAGATNFTVQSIDKTSGVETDFQGFNGNPYVYEDQTVDNGSTYSWIKNWLAPNQTTGVYGVQQGTGPITLVGLGSLPSDVNFLNFCDGNAIDTNATASDQMATNFELFSETDASVLKQNDPYYFMSSTSPDLNFDVGGYIPQGTVTVEEGNFSSDFSTASGLDDWGISNFGDSSWSDPSYSGFDSSNAFDYMDTGSGFDNSGIA